MERKEKPEIKKGKREEKKGREKKRKKNGLAE